jgi:hypothetical protein
MTDNGFLHDSIESKLENFYSELEAFKAQDSCRRPALAVRVQL